MAQKKEFWHDGLTRKDLENTVAIRMTIRLFTHTHVHYFEGFNVELLRVLINEINEADDMLDVESIKIDKV